MNAKTVGVLQPDQPALVIGHRAVDVVGEARDGRGDPFQFVAVLTGSSTGDDTACRVVAAGLPGFGELDCGRVAS